MSKQAKQAIDGATRGGGGGPVGMLMKLAVGAGAAGYLGYNGLFNVEGGHRAVMYNRVVGVKDSVYIEGTHFKIPFVEREVIYDVRTRPRSVSSLTGSRDLQMVNINLRVLSRPDIKFLPTIYRELGVDYDERVLPSIVNEVLKQAVAQFNASELLTQRDRVSRKVRNDLIERAADFHILLEDVSIIDLSFGREFTAAVEAKQVAQQEAERARFVVEKAKQEKRSIVIRAQGEAASAEMIGRSISDKPGFVELRRIDAARDIAQIVSRSSNRVYLNADSLLLNLLGDTGVSKRLKQ